MSIRNLDALFSPASVALIGASARPGSVGATVWRNLRAGGFAGPCWAVNPRHSELDGEPCFADVAALPAAPDLAVIATPPAAVAGVVAALAERGTRAAIVLTAGLDAGQRQAMLSAARPRLLRLLGPNGLGLLSPHVGLNASFSHAGVASGPLAFVSQSGALVTAMIDWARDRGIGFSHCVSLGESADIDFGDLLDWLGSDARTRAILLYAESVSAARKFMSAARAAARNKPVLIVKAGRSPRGQAAAASHTGALAGADAVIDAAIRRAGMLRVATLDELFIAAEMLARVTPRLRGAEADHARLDRLTIVTNGGGAGVLAADAAEAAGLALAPLTQTTRAALEAVLPANWSRANPVDLIGDAPVARYVQALGTLLADPEAGSLLFMHAPTAIVPADEIARALLPLAREAGGRLSSVWLGGPAVRSARAIFHAAGVPTHDTPEQAIHAFAMLVDYRRNQAQLLQTPPADEVACDVPAVRAIVDAALAAGREWLDPAQAGALLAACGVPMVATRITAPRVDAAQAAARDLGGPVALKIVSPELTHKSDVGGVALDLEDEAAVGEAARRMLARVAQARPDAQVEGFVVQAMARQPRAIELIAGTAIDPLFGPVVLFGAGGTAVEVLADRAVALPPLNGPLARAAIERTRVARLLAGWRDRPAADRDALARVLCALSRLLAEEPRIAELDINPLLADADGVMALDARVRVLARAPGGAARFAIRPYPAELEETIEWQGRTVLLRPIRPDDEARHLAFFSRLEPADIRLRIFFSQRSIEHSELARLTQIDYERELAFIAVAPDAANEKGELETLGVARAVCDPDNREAEFGIIVRSDLKGGGLGSRLMRKLIDTQRARGTERLVGTVLRENTRMLALARALGFRIVAERAEDPGTLSIELPLG
jgi:acetyltransferase